MKGRIIKGIGGFYYISTEQGIVRTRGRGIFRKEGITPMVGDLVEIEVLEDGDGVVNAVEPRRNQFSRPPVVNVDCMVIVFAPAEPSPNFDVIDKFLITAESKGVTPVLCMNKKDLVSEEEAEELTSRYRGVYPVLRVSACTGEGIAELKAKISGKASALAGPSGVGKSSITNLLIPDAGMETSGLSHKTGRGRHTTRHVEIFRLSGGGMLYDTPGFTSFDLSDVTEDELDSCYPEICERLGSCRFDDCHHIHEPGCVIREAVSRGEIHPLRYESYIRNFEELKEKRRKIYG